MSTVHDALQALTDLTPGRQQILTDVVAGLSRTPRSCRPSTSTMRAARACSSRSRRPPSTTPRAPSWPAGTGAAGHREASGPRLHVVELGSGSGRKTALLLAALHDPVAYTPIEISRAALLSSIDHLAPALPEVEMLPVCADFTRPVAVPMPEREPARRLLFFPGSTLGNFEGEDAVALLRAMRQTMGRDGLALVGIDLHKDPALIEAAYNDAQGVTAAFTLNLLARLNREIGSDFDLEGFRHRARYSVARLRIETDLVSQRAQDVHLDGRTFHFEADEPIRVEYSHKYTDESFEALLQPAGLQVMQRWDAEARLWPAPVACHLGRTASRCRFRFSSTATPKMAVQRQHGGRHAHSDHARPGGRSRRPRRARRACRRHRSGVQPLPGGPAGHRRDQGISADRFNEITAGLTPDPSVLGLLDAQPEFTTPIWDYLAALVDRQRVDDGRALLQQHRDLLDRVSAQYGVDPATIVAVWGVESDYGRVFGKRPLLQSLATLSCAGRRQAFFRGELLALLKLIDRGDLQAQGLTGSWAGAFGHTQFMPSTYARIAVDGDGDGRRDLVGSIPDALASTANYLKRAGWRSGEPWGMEVRVPPVSMPARRAAPSVAPSPIGVRRA
jgi:dimethylhistidine N-methyltransferase